MIKSDKWIIEKCTRPIDSDDSWLPMISPFVDHQVCYQDGKKILSYGVTSYGYDVTLARHFKIFTNAKNALIDPLNIQEDCFVNHEGDFCIIPPNSYILGHTNEYFNIPKNVSVICVGKSTYARCFTGDTLVKLVDGTHIAFKDMDFTKTYRGYGLDAVGVIKEVDLVAPRLVGHESVLRVHLSNFDYVDVTPDHRFCMWDHTVKRADQLLSGDLFHAPAYNTPAVSVVEVKALPGTHDVYCLTSPETGNFVLSSGVVVENCAAIVNVTPIEAGFSGQVVIEIANASTLPLKVYANQGISQFIFFESDEYCKTSYADRQGKYQGQTGITLSKG